MIKIATKINIVSLAILKNRTKARVTKRRASFSKY